jgi:hypothetical protein
MAANGGGPAMMMPGSSASGASTPPVGPAMAARDNAELDAIRAAAPADAQVDDFGLSSTFDVPAFLRRQDG